MTTRHRIIWVAIALIVGWAIGAVTAQWQISRYPRLELPPSRSGQPVGGVPFGLTVAPDGSATFRYTPEEYQTMQRLGREYLAAADERARLEVLQRMTVEMPEWGQ